MSWCRGLFFHIIIKHIFPSPSLYSGRNISHFQHLLHLSSLPLTQTQTVTWPSAVLVSALRYLRSEIHKPPCKITEILYFIWKETRNRPRRSWKVKKQKTSQWEAAVPGRSVFIYFRFPDVSTPAGANTSTQGWILSIHHHFMPITATGLWCGE